MTVLASIPVRRLQAGTHAIPPIQVPSGTTILAVSVTTDPGWPQTQNTLVTGTLEFSANGVDFTGLVVMEVPGIPDPDGDNPVTAFELLPSSGGGFVRGSVTLPDPLRAGAALEAF